jgi:hypothetical protein
MRPGSPISCPEALLRSTGLFATLPDPLCDNALCTRGQPASSITVLKLGFGGAPNTLGQGPFEFHAGPCEIHLGPAGSILGRPVGRERIRGFADGLLGLGEFGEVISLMFVAGTAAY